MKANKEHPNQQHCPACNRYVKYSQTYPNYACFKCVATATDEQGNRIAFYNITNDGHGMQAILPDSEKLVRATTCYIKGLTFEAQEADAGGIVLLPIKEHKPKRKRAPKAQKIDVPT